MKRRELIKTAAIFPLAGFANDAKLPQMKFRYENYLENVEELFKNAPWTPRSHFGGETHLAQEVRVWLPEDHGVLETRDMKVHYGPVKLRRFKYPAGYAGKKGEWLGDIQIMMEKDTISVEAPEISRFVDRVVKRYKGD